VWASRRASPTYLGTVPFLSGSELAEWVATVDLGDPLTRHFAAELHDLEAAGADPGWAMIVLLREAARLEAEAAAALLCTTLPPSSRLSRPSLRTRRIASGDRRMARPSSGPPSAGLAGWAGRELS
jgi:hypothetical protein